MIPKEEKKKRKYFYIVLLKLSCIERTHLLYKNQEPQNWQ